MSDQIAFRKIILPFMTKDLYQHPPAGNIGFAIKLADGRAIGSKSLISSSYQQDVHYAALVLIFNTGNSSRHCIEE